MTFRWLKSMLAPLLGAERAERWLSETNERRLRDGAAQTSDRIVAITQSARFEQVIIGLIIFNALLLGLETSQSFMARFGGLAYTIDFLILLIFTAEIAMRIHTYRGAFFRSAWGWFDLIVVLVSYLPSFSGFAALRVFRIFRLFRLFSMVPKMRRVINGFFAALPGMSGVVLVLALIFYVSAVITTTVFGQAEIAALPDGATQEDLDAVRELFGTLGASFFTLFQLMTLEDWAGGIVVPTLAVFPGALWFFIPFIVVTSFAVLNLFIGIIVDAMQDDRDHVEQEERKEACAAQEARAAAEALEADKIRRHDRARDDRRYEEIMRELRAVKLELAALNQTNGRDASSRR
ncbi:MAG: ion transporter [Pseudomonadota bacterium]